MYQFPHDSHQSPAFSRQPRPNNRTVSRFQQRIVTHRHYIGHICVGRRYGICDRSADRLKFIQPGKI
ncbi:hypothetical protein [Microcoleus sp. CAWBG58]|uniref:hypothetical protein n=1 Tax=Microcoleus sp. CAWBG58 TaxID=2841651 RepID=UPI0025DEEFB2|nr:hypothetical protein [Microcoleus sp. CAWBG58]